MNYVLRILADGAGRARRRYRFYLHWRIQEWKYRAYSHDRLRAVQWKKLIKLLEFAYDRIPFYREKFQQAGITPESIETREDLLRIPITTKDEVRLNFPDRLVASNRKFPPHLLYHTTGSTSDTVHFVHPDSHWRRTQLYDTYLRAGGITNTLVVVLTTPECSGATCSLDEEGSFRSFRFSRYQRSGFLRHLDPIVIIPSSEDILAAPAEYMDAILEIMSYCGPCIMVADPVYLGALARHLRATGEPVPVVNSITCTYELLTPSIEDVLREVFGCEIYTQYGGREVGTVANECEHHGLHVRMDEVMVEAIREGRPTHPGELGKVVITDLLNYNTPFIRYELGDTVALGDGACPCGRHTQLIEAVHGRTRDTITANGSDGDGLVTPLRADAAFRGLQGIAAYQLVQRSPNRYDVAVMSDGLPCRIDTDLVMDSCRSMLGQNSRIEVEVVDGIKPLPSKKYRFVYSEVPPAVL